MSGLDGLGWPSDESDTPETDAIVSRFRKGETSSDGLILTMEGLERKLNQATDRIHDMLKADDGQAFKEARKWLDANFPERSEP